MVASMKGRLFFMDNRMHLLHNDSHTFSPLCLNSSKWGVNEIEALLYNEVGIFLMFAFTVGHIIFVYLIWDLLSYRGAPSLCHGICIMERQYGLDPFCFSVEFCSWFHLPLVCSNSCSGGLQGFFRIKWDIFGKLQGKEKLSPTFSSIFIVS